MTANETLIERLRAACPEAFRCVYEAEKGCIYGLLLKLTGDPQSAGDLFQNVWLKLAKHRTELKADTHIRAWLCTVARHEFVSYRRAQRLDLTRVLLFGVETAHSVDACTGTDDEAGLDLQAALGRLSDSDREALLITSVEGLEPSDAALALGLSPPALRQRLTRARKRLREELSAPSLPSATGLRSL